MNVGVIDVDGKIPNLALMKLSAWHKARGDSVKLYEPLFDKPDIAYASKVFSFTPDFQYWPDCKIVKGGSGYDLNTELPPEVEGIYPDYSLYNCDYAIGFTTRGCVRRCPFCIVPEKEGHIRAVGDIYDFWNGQKQVMLLDNNLTALPEHIERICKQLIAERVRVDFNQGLDIRLLTDGMAKLLARVRLWKQIHFAFDHVSHEGAVRTGVATLARHMPLSRVMFYVLIGYDSTPEEDLYRVELLRGLRVDPFVMPYDKGDPYQKRFARWVNHKAIFKTVKWEDYR